MGEKLIIGSHVGMKAPDYFVGSVQEALSYNATTFMFYTRSPSSTFCKPLSDLKINEGIELLKKTHIDITNVIVHGPYLINCANNENIEKYNLSIRLLIDDYKRANAFGVKIYVLHPGSKLNLDLNDSIHSLADALNEVFKTVKCDTKIALETMAGKGNEIGKTFDEIAQIIANVNEKERVGVCLDTCHISDGGYDITDADKLLKEFDEKIGLDKLLVLHINDSKNPMNSHKDRHENIGYGEIGFDALNRIVHHPLLVNVPKILETPYFNGKPPYKKEIEMFRLSLFEKDWRNNL